MPKIFRSPWNHTAIKQFRNDHLLSQVNLASILQTTQQRISEWEQGRHKMKRAWSTLFTNAASQIYALRKSARTYATYRRHMKELFGVEVEAE